MFTVHYREEELLLGIQTLHEVGRLVPSRHEDPHSREYSWCRTFQIQDPPLHESPEIRSRKHED
jgi:hypothetical protein